MRRKMECELVLGRDGIKVILIPKIMVSGGVERVPWILDCSFWTIEVRFSHEFGEYRISTFRVL